MKVSISSTSPSVVTMVLGFSGPACIAVEPVQFVSANSTKRANVVINVLFIQVSLAVQVFFIIVKTSVIANGLHK